MTSIADSSLQRQVTRIAARLSGPVALVALWWLSSATGAVSARTFPSPGDVIDAGRWAISEGQLQEALWASLRRVIVGSVIGVASGASLALVAGLWRYGDGLIDSTMQIFKAIPVISLTPLLIVWLGLDEGIKIALVAIATALPIYLNTYGAIRNIDPRFFDVARTLELSSFETVRHVAVPAAVPGFLIGLRTSLTSAWLVLVFAEELNAPTGLGRLLSDARSWLRLDIVVLVVVMYAILGLLSYSLVLLLGRVLVPWRQERTS